MRNPGKQSYVYRRVALIGAIANPNVGDDAILDVQLNNLDRMFGDNYKAYVFSKDPSYTIRFVQDKSGEVLPIDYLHRLVIESQFDIEKIKKREEELLAYDEEEYKPVYSILHGIFKEIDVLHIIGGGYMNSLWPDMLLEVHMAAKLASKYGKKIFITGASTTITDEETRALITEIIDLADEVDYRDDSFKDLGYQSGGKIVQTLDDAVYYLSDREIPYDMSGRYANLVIHGWQNNAETISEKREQVILPFITDLLLRGELDYCNILYFSEGDSDFLSEEDFPEPVQEKIRCISFIDQFTYYAKEIVAHAYFNIGTRYHQAVFSLAASVPVFSIFSGDYYEQKIRSIHSVFNSDCFCDLRELSKERLSEFFKSVCDIRKSLEATSEKTRALYDTKKYIISKGYSGKDQEQEVLFERLSGNETKVSVIVPVYNMEAYLQKCLDSILRQSLTDIEIICINDGSTDRTQEILNENAWHDRRIKILTQTNQGVSTARNNGLKMARGEYVFFLDPDDWLYDKNVLSDLYNAAKYNKVLAAGGGFVECNKSRPGEFSDWSGNLCRYSFEEDKLYTFNDLQFDYGWIRFIYKREYLVNNNFWFPRRIFYEDPVWFVKVMHSIKTFYGVRRPVYCYRTGYKSYDLSHAKVKDLLRGIGDIIEFSIQNHYSELLDLERARLTKDYAEQIARYLIGRSDDTICRELDRINALLYPDNHRRVEYDICSWDKSAEINRLQATLHEKEQGLLNKENELAFRRKQVADIFNSMTWKIGDAALYLPKMIVRKVRHEE